MTAKQMLVTAEYFGTHALADADHSGPLLGLAAACEATLCDYLIQATCAAGPSRIDAGATFGKMIHWLNDATYPNNRAAEGDYLREYLTESAMGRPDGRACTHPKPRKAELDLPHSGGAPRGCSSTPMG